MNDYAKVLLGLAVVAAVCYGIWQIGKSEDGVITVNVKDQGSFTIKMSNQHIQMEDLLKAVFEDGRRDPSKFQVMKAILSERYGFHAYDDPNLAERIAALPYEASIAKKLRELFLSEQGAFRSPEYPVVISGPLASDDRTAAVCDDSELHRRTLLIFDEAQRVQLRVNAREGIRCPAGRSETYPIHLGRQAMRDLNRSGIEPGNANLKAIWTCKEPVIVAPQPVSARNMRDSNPGGHS